MDHLGWFWNGRGKSLQAPELSNPIIFYHINQRDVNHKLIILYKICKRGKEGAIHQSRMVCGALYLYCMKKTQRHNGPAQCRDVCVEMLQVCSDIALCMCGPLEHTSCLLQRVCTVYSTKARTLLGDYGCYCNAITPILISRELIKLKWFPQRKGNKNKTGGKDTLTVWSNVDII